MKPEMTRQQVRDALGLGDCEYKNGRFVKVGKFTYEDRLAARLNITTSMKIERRFAYLPMETVEGRVWLKSYWAFSAEYWNAGLHSGASFRTLFRTTSRETLKSKIKAFMNNLRPRQSAIGTNR